MATLRTVEFWPQTGLAGARWAEGPDEDAFVRSARTIGERYSEGIRPARVRARHPQLRLHCFPHEPGRGEVLVTVFTEPMDGFEMAGVTLPDGVAALSSTARAALALDVMHAAALRMAQARGWDPAAFAAARAHVVAHDLRFRWTGPAKSAPGRRYTARPVCTISDDGLGRLVVEIRRVPDGTLVGASAEIVTPGSERTFRRVARTLRWRDGGTVEINPGERWHSTRVEEPPPLTVRAEGANSPESVPRINVIGGYSDDAVPETYSTALHLLTDELGGPQWTTWWSGAPDDVLEISYDLIARGPAGMTARRGGNKLRVRLDRPLADILAAGDRVALARADVEAVLATARRRAGLGPHPQLPDLARLAAGTTERIEADAALIRRMHAVLDRLADRLPAQLLASLHAELDDGRTGDVMSAVRSWLAHLGVPVTEAERAEFEALAATWR
ncbi:hypothetical protein ACQP2P_21045 [Dactylosporangium sp. CA-139114]|uniref:hypothetical protein n=1 Tax=Dactylosporangium sp. CA-139114 TaxID=3239931 RepID=UPI003D95251D